MFTRLKESVIYTWNGSVGFRYWVKRLTCPCFGCCYFLHSCKLNDCTGRRRRARQNKRDMTMSEINLKRRVRRLENRKRSVSVDGGRWRKRKAEEQQQSAFFSRLPPELRLKIYEMVLCKTGEVMIVAHNNEPWDYLRLSAIRACSTNILRTCRRVYREAVDILYSRNTLNFNFYATFITFSQSILPQRLHQIRSITISTMVFSPISASSDILSTYLLLYHETDLFALIASMPSLKTITLSYAFVDSWYLPDSLSCHFDLLESFATRSLLPGCSVYYKIDSRSELSVGSLRQGGETQTGLLAGRWLVNKRVKLR